MTTEPFSTFITGQSATTPASGDLLPLVRSGVTYQVGYPFFASTYSYQQPTTGATLTATTGLGAFIIEPAAEIATLTVIAPPSAVDQQIFEISTTKTIDALTVSPAAGQSLIVTAGITLTANSGMAWRYRAANTTWYPK